MPPWGKIIFYPIRIFADTTVFYLNLKVQSSNLWRGSQISSLCHANLGFRRTNKYQTEAKASEFTLFALLCPPCLQGDTGGYVFSSPHYHGVNFLPFSTLPSPFGCHLPLAKRRLDRVDFSCIYRMNSIYS